MGDKFNGGAGGKVCDGCGAMVLDGRRVIAPFVTVLLDLPKDHPEGAPAPAMHFCRRACLARVVEETIATLDAGDGEGLEITPRDFVLLVRREERWRAAEEGALPHDDAVLPCVRVPAP